MAPNPRRSGRSKRTKSDGSKEVPNIYNDMLVEAALSSPTQFDHDGKSIKKRRTQARRSGVEDGGASLNSSKKHSVTDEQPEASKKDLSDQQNISKEEQVSESGSEETDEDVDWENVDLEAEESEQYEDPDDKADANGELEITVDRKKSSGGPTSTAPKRRAVSAAERNFRLQIHKLHILCLIAHVRIRNHWCNDKAVQAQLKPLLNSRALSYLNPDPKFSQFQFSRSLAGGLEQASNIWRSKFRITARGLKSSSWAENAKALNEFKIPEDVDAPMEIEDFRQLAQDKEGSRDIGAMLFCALLRSAGVEARLVCSLQPLPLNTTSATSLSPNQMKHARHVVDFRDTTQDLSAQILDGKDSKYPNSPQRDEISPAARRSEGRLGASIAGLEGFQSTVPVTIGREPKRKKFRESRFPVYWIEAFDRLSSKWIPADPIVTQTVGKPAKLEPTLSERENNMSYVISFENDGHFRDITRRYVKAYNAKVRRQRVEMYGGTMWWLSVNRILGRGWILDRDQIESLEFEKAERNEPMPKNVQDFKDHPYFALERHLRSKEVIYPKEEVGKVATGKSSGSNATRTQESVYQRRHVLEVKSADRWYRIGREIKTGEQPLKYAAPRNEAKETLQEEEGDGEADELGVPLYAMFQTDLYESPPVVNGRVPKNSFGNIDIYVNSMVPRGGVHINHSDAAKAAKIIGVDYADAVTGFEFRGRHGTPVIRGVIVANEYKEAIIEVLRAMEHERIEVEKAQKIIEALKLWRKLYIALGIRERVQGYEVEGENTEDPVEKEIDDGADDFAAGGFIPDPDDGPLPEPTARRKTARRRSPEPPGGGFFTESRPSSPVPNEQRSETFRQTDIVKESRAEELPKQVSNKVPDRPSLKASRSSSMFHLEVQDADSEMDEAQDDIVEQVKAISRLESQRESQTDEKINSASEITQQSNENGMDFNEIGVDAAAADVTMQNLQQSHEKAEQLEEPIATPNSLSQGSLLSHDPDDDDAEPEWLYD